MGLGHFEKVDVPTKLKYKFEKFCCGNDHVLALDSKNNAYAWGNNYYGQLGIGSFENRCVPVLTKLNVKNIYCGSTHSFILANNIIYSFGDNDWYYIYLIFSGQLGKFIFI